MPITNHGKSIHDKLLNISKARNLSYQTVVSRYIQERLLYRLSISRFKEHFFLKGGALIYAFGGLDARPTVDIDFLGEKISRDIAALTDVFKEVCSIAYAPDGVTFDLQSMHAEELMLNNEYNGVRIQVKTMLHSMHERVSMDIGFGDIIYNGAQHIDYPVLLDNAPINLLAYSAETVVAEKFEAMIKLGLLNSRMKDFYDVYTILQQDIVDYACLQNAIKATFENRGTLFDSTHPLLSADFSNDTMRNNQWRAYLKKIRCNQELPFHEVVAYIVSRLVTLFADKL